ESGTRLEAFADGELLLSQPEICNNYSHYFDLYRLGPGGRLRRLTECGRFRFAAPLEDGRIAAIRVVGGEAEVVLLNSRGELERSLYRAAPGEALTGLAAKGGTVVVTSLHDERASPPGADRPYSAWSSLRPRYWLPNGYAADGALALGFATDGQDALGLHQYALAPMYEITQHQALGSAAYVYDNRHGLLLNRTMTVKASTPNDQKSTGRDIRAYEIDETAQWVSLWRRLRFNVSHYWGLGGAL